MHARVATFEGGEAEKVRQMAEEIDRQSASGPPEGVPAVGLLLLRQADGQKVLAITLFETEEDLREGDATLSAMDPPVTGGLGRRASVEMFEVAVKRDL